MIRALSTLILLGLCGLPAMAETLGWSRINLQSLEAVTIAVNYETSCYSTAVGPSVEVNPLWIDIYSPDLQQTRSSARAVLLTYKMPENELLEAKEIDLYMRRDGHAAGEYARGYQFDLVNNLRQELAVVVDGKWLTDPVSRQHNFNFNLWQPIEDKAAHTCGAVLNGVWLIGR